MTRHGFGLPDRSSDLSLSVEEVLSIVLSKNEKGPPCGEPKSLFHMVPAPRVELGTY